MRGMSVLTIIGSSFGVAVVASFVVLVIGMCLFGFQLAQWAEWEGRIMGVAGTIAGVVGAVAGVKMALRVERRAVK